MQRFSIRMAGPQDAQAVLDVYAPYVTDTSITFECEVPELSEFQARMRAICAEYPYIVCLCQGRVIGFAYAHRQKERAAYRWNAELSVYINKAYTGLGIGRAFYYALTEILRMQNVYNVYGGVTTPNPASEGLHAAFGFVQLGVYAKTGYKSGKWHDVKWYEKELLHKSGAPEPFLPMDTLDAARISDILSQSLGFINLTLRTRGLFGLPQD